MPAKTKTIEADADLVAYCGLYCGACRSHLRGRCPGCHLNTKATWCKVRLCNIEHRYLSCAQCAEFPNPGDCRKFNNFVSRMIGFVLRSDRPACIAQIKAIGIQGHAGNMAQNKRQSIKR